MRRYGSGAVRGPDRVARPTEHDELEIPFVAHLGDVVDRADQTQEWEVADAAMRTLDDAALPYSIMSGNHDVRANDEESRDPSTEHYLRYFPTSRGEAQPGDGGRDACGWHEWHTFRAEGREFLVISLGWNPSDRAIAWARQVLADHPRLPAILTVHDILNIASDGVTAVETNAGLRLWNELIRDNDQIFLTLNGHNHGSAHLRKTNDFGHSVDQIVWDYQMAYQGGNAYLGLLEFDFTNDTIDTAVVSPVGPPQAGRDARPDFDQAVKTGPNENLQHADRLERALRPLRRCADARRGRPRLAARRRQESGARRLRASLGRRCRERRTTPTTTRASTARSRTGASTAARPARSPSAPSPRETAPPPAPTCAAPTRRATPTSRTSSSAT